MSSTTPTNQSANNAAGARLVTISWSAPTNTTNLSNYIVYVYDASNTSVSIYNTSTAITTPPTLPSKQLSISTVYVKGRSYVFTVQAMYNGGTTSGGISGFTNTVSPTINMLPATSVFVNTSKVASWVAPSTSTGGNPAVGYNVWVNGVVDASVNVTTANLSSYLSNGTRYSIVVQSFNNVGNSVMSDAIYVTPPNASCFNEGTQILCFDEVNGNEVYKPIETLSKGELVKTYKHGYRKIDLIGKGQFKNDPNVFHSCMYKLPKTENMVDDLMITGYHSILVDDLNEHLNEKEIAHSAKLFGGELHKIDDKYLLLSSISSLFTKMEDDNMYTYYHFVLEGDGNPEDRYGIYANGVLCDTPTRKIFLKNFGEPM